MKKNIVFDVGNVLCRFEPEKMLALYGLNQEEIDLAINEVFNSQGWLDCDRGLGTHSEILPAYMGKLNARTRKAVEDLTFDPHFEVKHIVPDEKMADLVKSLKHRGFRIYILSNFAFGYRDFFPTVKAISYADGVFPSCDYKLMKPEQEIFKKFYEVFSLNPGECLFIDDNPANNKASIQSGMDSINFNVLFHSVEELSEKIENFLK